MVIYWTTILKLENLQMRFIIFFFALTISYTSLAQDLDFVVVSQNLLETTREKQPTKDIQDQLAKVSLRELSKDLDTDERRLAFWINVYNAYIQILLTDDATLFDDRSAFFTEKRMTIAGQKVSFDNIEHGIIRASQSKYTLGLIPKFWGVSEYEKKLRVQERDGRVHFALNCGAKSCPPIPVLTAKRLDQQLDAASKAYLEATTKYDKEADAAHVTPLFSWFRGDFGGLSGVKSYLRHFEIIPAGANPSLDFLDYDWTLDLNNYVDL